MMDHDGIFKSKDFYKHRNDREKEYVIEKDDHVYYAQIYVAGKYRPIKCIDIPIRVNYLDTSEEEITISIVTELPDGGIRGNLFYIDKVDFLWGYIQTLETIPFDARTGLFKITSVTHVKSNKIKDFLSYDLNFSGNLFTITNVNHDNTMSVVDLETMHFDQNVPETMIRLEALYSTNISISYS